MELLERHRIDYAILKIVRPINRGADGSLFEVKLDNQRFAMKQIHNSRVEQYNAEKVALMLKLDHPNLIRLQYVLTIINIYLHKSLTAIFRCKCLSRFEYRKYKKT